VLPLSKDWDSWLTVGERNIKTFFMTIFYIIKELRQARKLTQKEFAKKIGISDVYLGLIEKGDRIPSDDILKKIAEVFSANQEERRNLELHLLKERAKLIVAPEIAAIIDKKTTEVQKPLQHKGIEDMIRNIRGLPSEDIDRIVDIVNNLIAMYKKK
jgi:transcriptional regulator with XRE-family HTH domain